LTPRRERLLDAIAVAGGLRQPVDKITVQLSRGDQSQTIAMESIVRNPRDNIVLHPDDVITVLCQPYSFTALGATGRNAEVSFEAKGISLTQALARAGGLLDHRANRCGIFIFRFERKSTFKWPQKPVATTPQGKVPVVYWLDMSDPASIFAAKVFPICDDDVIYVANARGAQLQKFLNLISSIVQPTLNTVNASYRTSDLISN